MHYLNFAIVTASVLLIATPALAQDRSTTEPTAGSLYLGGFLGDQFGRKQTLSGANPAGQPRAIETSAKDGLTGGLVIGAVAATGPWGRARVEVELAASRNKLNTLSLNGQRRALLEGNRTATTQIVNFIYDTQRIAERIRFSLGGGVGHGSIDYDTRYLVTANGPQINIPTSVSGKVAFQGIAGGSVVLGKALELTSDVRYSRVARHQVERFNATAGTLDSVLSTRYSNLVATAGFRYFF